MSTFSVDGLVSGLNTTDIIARLGQLDRAPIARLQTRKASTNTQLQALQTLTTRLNALRDKGAALDKTAAYQAVKASSADTAAITVSASASALPGTFAIKVESLAAAHQVVTGTAFAETDEGIFGTGTIALTVGETTTNIAIGAANNSLAGIAAAINASGAGATASLVTGESGTHLVLTSNTSGEDYEVSLSSSLSGGSATIGSFNEWQAASDAQVRIGSGPSSIVATRSTNVLTDVIPGVTLSLGATTASAVSVRVEKDPTAVRNAVVEFVAAYNDVVGTLAAQTAYNAETRVAGPLQGSPIVGRIAQRLGQLVSATLPPSAGSMRTLADIGITLARDGKLAVDNAKLDGAINANVGGVRALLGTTGSASDSDVAFLSATTKAVPPGDAGYAVAITQAATIGTWTTTARTQGLADPGVAAATVSGGTETLTFDGALFDAPVAIDFVDGTTASEMVDLINADTSLNDKVYAWLDGGALRLAGRVFGRDFTVTSSGAGTGSGYSTSGTASAQSAVGVPGAATGRTAVAETLTFDGTLVVDLAAGLTLAQARDAINAALADADRIDRVAIDGTGRALTLSRNQYGSGTTTVVSSSADDGALGIGTTATVVAGLDVAGTIDGQAATGRGQVLTGNAGNSRTDSVALRVGLSTDELTAQGAAQGTVRFTHGAAVNLAALVNELNAADTGILATSIVAVQARVKDFDRQIALIDERARARETAYRRQFTALETQLSTLRQQSQWLSQQVVNLSGGGGNLR